MKRTINFSAQFDSNISFKKLFAKIKKLTIKLMFFASVSFWMHPATMPSDVQNDKPEKQPSATNTPAANKTIPKPRKPSKRCKCRISKNR
jgi:hypothetical protein